MASLSSRRSVMTLFSAPDCADSHRVRIVLAEKDITVDILNINPDNKPEDLAELNPYNTTPTLLDRDLVLYDARIIMEYLDERFPHPPLMPVDPVTRAHSRLALFRIEKDWFSLVHDIEHGDTDTASQARKILRESVLSAAEVFAVKPYFLSDDFSLVDCTIAPILWRLPKYGIDVPEKQGKPILKYMERVFSRDAFQQSLSKVEKSIRP
ncbi:glutathione S-transferase N-terminal domain-containing protein [Thiothrix subterranea]|uniref:Glutathione S-transferase N-terminal domain-containing protein n=1 Tax=Thiothrix subterranea TaxID=2735563 RepID=A0AA51MRX1_9GAMM|nr:glutathione S-transferase N-terminal domain-containing protein [Thiothrix subterranea]MDQ5767340.1 glutathione S-transferase N-terminal domain-containing protein [Thiothrix subterranea]QQZ30101.1 stringent starvation protein A [Thiothrix subterranea]WML88799.1 glutathione S-transferase N-terminal domain-containing protein [Thiothrix subterranea]